MTPDETCALLACRIREERLLRGWSRPELAVRASVSPPVVYRAEAGEWLSFRTVLLIAQGLDVPAAELLAEPETAEAAS
jgi:transcriptional regulator with XRE-family HTH domain